MPSPILYDRGRLSACAGDKSFLALVLSSPVAGNNPRRIGWHPPCFYHVRLANGIFAMQPVAIQGRLKENGFGYCGCAQAKIPVMVVFQRTESAGLPEQGFLDQDIWVEVELKESETVGYFTEHIADRTQVALGKGAGRVYSCALMVNEVTPENPHCAPLAAMWATIFSIRSGANSWCICIEKMVAHIAARGAQWGFSGVTFIDHQGAGIDSTSPLAQSHLRSVSNVLGKITNSFAFLEFNPCISTGNLFVEKSLFRQTGGFRPLKYNHDWDFCLRASAISEPVFLEPSLYRYRLHGKNTIGESNDKNKEDANRFFADYYRLLETTTTAENDLSPAHADNRPLSYKIGLGIGHGELLPTDRLRSMSMDWLSRLHSLESRLTTYPELRNEARKQALVVLGMHRSGTSALARVLNLCGAFLPDNRRPAKLNNNDKGFWESEEIIQLNERLLKAMGASWLDTKFDADEIECICRRILFKTQRRCSSPSMASDR